VDKVNIFHKVILSKWFLLFPLVVILFVLTSITIEEIIFLSGHFDAEGAKFIEKNEETLAILLIGFGVVMEGREIFSRKVKHMIKKKDFEEHHELNDISEYYGFILLVIGLFIEIVDQIARYAHNYENFVLFLEAGVNMALNGIAFIYIVAALIRIFKVKIKPHQI
jgi:uncharacterized membrane protein YidH (DUF202 family)